MRIVRTRSRESTTPRNIQIASVAYKPTQSPTRKPPVIKRSQTDISIKVIKKKNVVQFADPKKKSYDPEAARKYIQDQKMKRKLHVEESANEKNSKDEIKKRLEVLRNNSRKILSDNVNKKRSNSTPRSMSFLSDRHVSKDKVR